MTQVVSSFLQGRPRRGGQQLTATANFGQFDGCSLQHFESIQFDIEIFEVLW